ncbi:MAG: FAD-binding oxidoreductase [Hyphomicrobiales bacterium]
MTAGDFPSWGRLKSHARRACTIEAMRQGDQQAESETLLPYGNGRSYGDSCHNDAGVLIHQGANTSILNFDTETGLMQVQAGALLVDVLEMAIPHGFFLAVSPGTRFVSIAGAIANDVHGKNHHVRGTFGCHVERFSLWRSDGVIHECSASENSDLFAATIGGMGLTGIILDATIRLMKVPSADVRQTTIKFQNLSEYFSAIDEVDNNHEYSVAWIDQLAKGAKLGRGAMMAGDHVAGDGTVQKVVSPRLSVPFQPPVNLLNRFTLSAFNAAYYAKARAGETVVRWPSYFYPLDGIKHWNRLYGPKGLFQHQSVYPSDAGEETTAHLIECAQAHGHASFLTVLKRFGDVASPGLFSFPKPGFTLTLDFANQGPPTLKMLDALDEITLKAGGRINPYKDARMSARAFAASFPEWPLLEAARDLALMSDFWRRTAKCLRFSAMVPPTD